MLSKFLNKELGIPEDVAEQEACLMEHISSDESFEKWKLILKSSTCGAPSSRISKKPLINPLVFLVKASGFSALVSATRAGLVWYPLSCF